jgi:hypothetical protein
MKKAANPSHQIIAKRKSKRSVIILALPIRSAALPWNMPNLVKPFVATVKRILHGGHPGSAWKLGFLGDFLHDLATSHVLGGFHSIV